MTLLHAVLAPTDGALPRPLHVDAARRAARGALARSAKSSGAELGPARFDARGAPLPANGWHRSVAHTRGLAAAIVAPEPVGIDVERLDRPRAQRILEPGLSAAERVFLEELTPPRLLRLWTAKEALLKRAGCGLAELSDCRLIAPFQERVRASESSHGGRTVIWLEHRGSAARVLQLFADDACRVVPREGQAAFSVAVAYGAGAFGLELETLASALALSAAEGLE